MMLFLINYLILIRNANANTDVRDCLFLVYIRWKKIYCCKLQTKHCIHNKLLMGNVLHFFNIIDQTEWSNEDGYKKYTLINIKNIINELPNTIDKNKLLNTIPAAINYEPIYAPFTTLLNATQVTPAYANFYKGHDKLKYHIGIDNHYVTNDHCLYLSKSQCDALNELYHDKNTTK